MKYFNFKRVKCIPNKFEGYVCENHNAIRELGTWELKTLGTKTYSLTYSPSCLTVTLSNCLSQEGTASGFSRGDLNYRREHQHGRSQRDGHTFGIAGDGLVGVGGGILGGAKMIQLQSSPTFLM